MTPALTLATRCENAGPEMQRELLREAWKIIRQPCHTCAEWRAFAAMLDAEAYESAALSLKPEGWLRSFTDDPDDLGGVIAELWTKKRNAWANASTPALALTAAILRAMEVG